MILAVGTRLAIKYNAFRKLGVDDGLVAVAMGQYATDMLYAAALAFSKLSSIAYMIQLTPDRRHRTWAKAILAAVATWATAFWDAIGAMDVMTDLALVALPMYIVWNLQMARKHKIAVTIAFGCRIISALNSTDETFEYRQTIFCMLADVNASILVACIPFLKPFMQGLESGLLTSDLRVRGPTKSLFANISSDMEVGKGRKDNGYPLNRMSGNNKSGIRRGSRSLGWYGDDGLGHRVNIAHQPRDRDFERRSSSGSDKMIIKQTTEFNVVHDADHISSHHNNTKLTSVPAIPLTTTTLQTNPPIHISHAHAADFPSLAAILALASAVNPIERFMFKHDNEHQETPSARWAMAQFQNARSSSDNGDVTIVRIIESESQRPNDEVEIGSEPAFEKVTDKMLDPEFYEVYIASLKEIYER
ncbi:MAG: hypothetical protein LQ338_005409 [Usnochroma carphineum]|nr:MAG: hypothetical protein LQ338_005409 [Usnochroma carphineum]